MENLKVYNWTRNQPWRPQMGKGQMDLRIEQTNLECLRESEDCHRLNGCVRWAIWRQGLYQPRAQGCWA